MKKLHRSKDNVVFAGILGGIAEYYDTDPLVARLIFLFFTFSHRAFPRSSVSTSFAVIIIPQKPLIS
jgi:phage shock protein C